MWIDLNNISIRIAEKIACIIRKKVYCVAHTVVGLSYGSPDNLHFRHTKYFLLITQYTIPVCINSNKLDLLDHYTYVK